jgi:hypothetical protein
VVVHGIPALGFVSDNLPTFGPAFFRGTPPDCRTCFTRTCLVHLRFCSYEGRAKRVWGPGGFPPRKEGSYRAKRFQGPGVSPRKEDSDEGMTRFARANSLLRICLRLNLLSWSKTFQTPWLISLEPSLSSYEEMVHSRLFANKGQGGLNENNHKGLRNSPSMESSSEGSSESINYLDHDTLSLRDQGSTNHI